MASPVIFGYTDPHFWVGLGLLIVAAAGFVMWVLSEPN